MDTRGILHPRTGLQRFQLHRYLPPAPLTPYVDRLWCVRWDLADGEVFEQPVLAHPCVNVVVEPHRAAVYGVPSKLRSQRITGRGWAVAAMFSPGGVRPFLRSRARDWVDRDAQIADHWGRPGSDLVAAIRRACGDDDAVEQQRVGLLSSFLTELAPPVMPAATTAAATAAALVADDRALCRVEELADRTDITVRSLQRLFAEHVGLSPKKVIRRYRLLEAAEAAAGGQSVSWAEVAVQLGFSDQAHLTRDFTAAFGVSPSRYAAASPRG